MIMTVIHAFDCTGPGGNPAADSHCLLSPLAANDKQVFIPPYGKKGGLQQIRWMAWRFSSAL